MPLTAARDGGTDPTEPAPISAAVLLTAAPARDGSTAMASVYRAAHGWGRLHAVERADLLEAGIEQEGDDLLITLTGELDHASAPGLRDRLAGSVGEDSPSLTFVCDGLRFIDSAGLRLLLELHHDLDAQGGRVRVVHPVEQVARSMAVTGLDVVIEVVPDPQVGRGPLR